MKRSALAASVTACFCLGFAAPLLAAETTPTNTQKARSHTEYAAATSAKTCLSDLRAFDSQMDHDGYWLSGSGYGYGYPMLGYGYGRGGLMGGGPIAATASAPQAAPNTATPADNDTAAAAPARNGYWQARPGYEVRTLLASANILAQHGQQKACETVLSTTRTLYKNYAADLRHGGMAMANVPVWRRQQIAAATPVTGKDTSFRSDELVGTDVRSPQDDALGSVDDLVMSPQTGKIAYLVIGRGGIFGIDEKYVPVPWEDFKVTPGMHMLVLDTTKKNLDAAPQVDHDRFSNGDHFDALSRKVDAYWKANLASSSTGSKG